jgi:pyridoxal phosphate enzyme (YggS family)
MIEQQMQQRLSENWQAVQQKVREVAINSGRAEDSVQIIGVSKYVDAETTLALVKAGCRQLGESRPQLMWQKTEELTFDQPVIWHMIGHLQRNKVRRLLRSKPMIHSVEHASNQGLIVDVLLEVNVSADEAKTGFLPESLEAVLDSLPAAGVRVKGLMAMAGWGTSSDAARTHFDKTRELRDRLSQSSGQALPELSMGMSGDFPEAIRAGATMVRIGSILFEGLIDQR